MRPRDVGGAKRWKWDDKSDLESIIAQEKQTRNALGTANFPDKTNTHRAVALVLAS